MNDQLRFDLQKKKAIAENATKLHARQVMTFFFFFFLENTAECGLNLTSKHQDITTRLRAMTSYECLCGEKFWRMD